MTRDSDPPSPRSLSSQSSSASDSSSSDDYLSYSSSSSDTSSEDEYITLVRALKEFRERRYGNRDIDSADSGEDQDDEEAAIASKSSLSISIPSTPSTPSLPSTTSTPSLSSPTPSPALPAQSSPLAPQSLPPAPPSPTQRLLLNMGKQRAQRRLYAPGRTAALRDLENCRPCGDTSKGLICQKDRRDETSTKRKHTKENGAEDHRVSSTEATGAVGASSPSGGGALRGRKRRRVGSS
ncbi:MAG: hypothetical protein Q9226_003004 [Calogaya cf. arnoldii]